MHWSDEMLDGWLLAQTLHEDVAPEDALTAGVSRQVAARQRAYRGQSKDDRRRDLQRIAGLLRSIVAAARGDEFPIRMRALLATDVPREKGSGWLREAGPTRRGFRPSVPLLQALRALARERR